ncbi:MAG: Asp23/Gls24 family envelope stress response protein [Lachnospiraceae bacterium]|nr:Asp23/Gls24 family envelope stress response protein [Lachnospiraceae bacterium]
MKGSLVDTHLGNIIIDASVITQYAGSVAVECFGIVGMANVNMKDGLVKLLKINSADIGRGVSVSMSESNKLILDFHVIVAYGVSIKAVIDNLISNVKYKVEEFSGIEIEKVNVFVEDVKVID